MSIDVDNIEQRFDIACKFVIKLGMLVHKYGSQSKRLELSLIRTIVALGYNGIFKVTPTDILFNFTKSKDDIWGKVHIVNTQCVMLDLDKLGKAEEIIDSLEKNEITLLAADKKLELICKEPPPYNKITIALGYLLTSTGFAGFLNFQGIEIFLSALLGILVYAITLCFESLPERIEYLKPFFCAFISGVIAAFACMLFHNIHPYLIVLSAVIYLIPGYTISSGVVELTYKYVLSGLINIVNGLFFLVLLFGGAWLGISAVSHFFKFSFIVDTYSTNIISIFTIIFSIGMCIICQIPKRDYIWALVCVLITCVGIFFGSKLFNTYIGVFLGTIFAIIFSNIWSKKTNRSASLVLIPSFMFLVSGSIGFRGFVAMSLGNTISGQQQFIQMFIVSLVIAAGLAIGNIIYRPRIMALP